MYPQSVPPFFANLGVSSVYISHDIFWILEMLKPEIDDDDLKVEIPLSERMSEINF